MLFWVPSEADSVFGRGVEEEAGMKFLTKLQTKIRWVRQILQMWPTVEVFRECAAERTRKELRRLHESNGRANTLGYKAGYGHGFERGYREGLNENLDELINEAAAVGERAQPKKNFVQ